MVTSTDWKSSWHAQELITAVEQKLHIIVLLLNDSAYGMIKWKAVSLPIPASTSDEQENRGHSVARSRLSALIRECSMTFKELSKIASCASYCISGHSQLRVVNVALGIIISHVC